jgi:hypothetical protein
MRISRYLAICLLACIPPALAAEAGKPTPAASSTEAPTGSLPPAFNIPGVRASSTLATEVHCSNLSAAAVSVYVDFYQYDGTYQCGLSYASMAVGTTRTFTTGDSASFLEDQFCVSTTAIGQGLAVVRTFPVGAKIACSAEIVALTGDPPATLGALDVHPAQ